MKLVRYGSSGSERPGVLDAEGRIRDLSGMVPDIADWALLPESLERLRMIDLKSLRLVEGPVRLGPCVGGVGKFRMHRFELFGSCSRVGDGGAG